MESQKIICEHWESMEPWKSVDDIPEIPKIDKELYERYIVPSIIRCGGIPKCKLSVGATYKGSCRNTDTATWDGEKFVYDRHKFGSTYEDEVNHFEDDDGYDLFVPMFIV